MEYKNRWNYRDNTGTFKNFNRSLFLSPSLKLGSDEATSVQQGINSKPQHVGKISKLERDDAIGL